MKLYHLFLQDELRGLNGGYRTLFAKVGRKWVHWYDWTNGKHGKIRRHVWEQMEPRVYTSPSLRPRYIKRRIKETIARKGREPTAFEREVLAWTGNVE